MKDLKKLLAAGADPEVELEEETAMDFLTQAVNGPVKSEVVFFRIHGLIEKLKLLI